MKINKQQLNQKGKVEAILAAIVLVVIVVVGYWYVRVQNETTGSTSTSTVSGDEFSNIDTSDWKTYEIDKYGVSFKYPPEYSNIEVDDNPEPYDMEYMVVFRNNEQPYNRNLGTFGFLLRLESLDELHSNVLDVSEIVSEKNLSVNGFAGVEIEDLDLDKSRTSLYTSHAIHAYIEYVPNKLFSVGGGIDTGSESRETFFNMVKAMITTLSIEKTMEE